MSHLRLVRNDEIQEQPNYCVSCGEDAPGTDDFCSSECENEHMDREVSDE